MFFSTLRSLKSREVVRTLDVAGILSDVDATCSTRAGSLCRTRDAVTRSRPRPADIVCHKGARAAHYLPPPFFLNLQVRNVWSARVPLMSSLLTQYPNEPTSYYLLWYFKIKLTSKYKSIVCALKTGIWTSDLQISNLVQIPVQVRIFLLSLKEIVED